MTIAFICKMSWYETRRHIHSHTDMYFMSVEDFVNGATEERVFYLYEEIADGTCRVYMIPVDTQSDEYQSALHNSNINNNNSQEENN